MFENRRHVAQPSRLRVTAASRRRFMETIDLQPKDAQPGHELKSERRAPARQVPVTSLRHSSDIHSPDLSVHGKGLPHLSEIRLRNSLFLPKNHVPSARRIEARRHRRITRLISSHFERAVLDFVNDLAGFPDILRRTTLHQRDDKLPRLGIPPKRESPLAPIIRIGSVIIEPVAREHQVTWRFRRGPNFLPAPSPLKRGGIRPG
jgi:hypothetical protein